MRLELTRVNLLVYFANHYTTWGALTTIMSCLSIYFSFILRLESVNVTDDSLFFKLEIIDNETKNKYCRNFRKNLGIDRWLSDLDSLLSLSNDRLLMLYFHTYSFGMAGQSQSNALSWFCLIRWVMIVRYSL